MPINIEDVEDFFGRHPEFNDQREKIVQVAKGTIFNGIIYPDAIPWFMDGLYNQFISELDCVKI